MISVHFGSVWLRSAPFGSVWLRFGSVPGPFRVCFGGAGWGRGGVGERGFCKGKEYHYPFVLPEIPLGVLEGVVFKNNPLLDAINSSFSRNP